MNVPRGRWRGGGRISRSLLESPDSVWTMRYRRNCEPTKQKSRPSSEREATEMAEQSAVELGLRVPIGKREELDVVGVLQLVEHAAMNLSQRR